MTMSAQACSDSLASVPPRHTKRIGLLATVVRRVGIMIAAILATWAVAMARPLGFILLPILSSGLLYFVTRRRFADAVFLLMSRGGNERRLEHFEKVPPDYAAGVWALAERSA
jgi:hypothetical protein